MDVLPRNGGRGLPITIASVYCRTPAQQAFDRRVTWCGRVYNYRGYLTRPSLPALLHD